MSAQANIILRPDHTVSRNDVSENALKVLYRLHNAGYHSHLVGGCVRDLLLGRSPKDFDVVTNAHPEDVNQLFDNCRLIGRRFRLAHIVFGRDIIEVATFRGHHGDDESHVNADSGRLVRDNVYGTIEEDVWRRDFTMNALYYDIANFNLVDYLGGLEDIQKQVIRLIGDPDVRYREDPVRMLRAVRFAAKLGFSIEPDTAEPIFKLGHLLADIPPARLFDEVLKLFQSGHALRSFQLLREYKLLPYLFGLMARHLEKSAYPHSEAFMRSALENTDVRIQQGKSVNPAFLYACFLWLPLTKHLQHQPGQAMPGVLEIQKAGSWAIHEQLQQTAIPRRFVAIMRDMWTLQTRLERYKGKRALKLLQQPRFRAAYDLLCLRAKAGEGVQASADWWTEIQEKEPAQQQQMADAKTQSKRKRQSSRSRRYRHRKASKPAE